MIKFNKAINILLITNGFVLIAGAMLGPIYALFVEEIGGDLLDASYAFGAFSLAAGIATLFSGKYTDKVKEKELVVVFGYILMGVGFLLYLTVNSVLSLVIVQVIIGIGGAVYAPAFDAVYAIHVDEGRSGGEWGAWEALNYFAAAFGAVSGGLLVTHFGFDVMFVVMGALCFASALYIFRLPRQVL